MDILYLYVMSKIILYGILLYLLYKFVFELVIPVGKATSQVKKTVQQMQEQQAEQQRQFQQYQQQQQQAAAQAQQARPNPEKSADYIDFEEVKWFLKHLFYPLPVPLQPQV